MTTIAFDGRCVAVDRGCWNNSIVDVCHKLFDVPNDVDQRLDMVIALCGYIGSFQSVVDHIRKDCTDKFPHEDYDVNPNNYIGIAFKSDGVYKIWGNARLEKIPMQILALGSGHEFAKGALLAGASAKQTVELAMMHTDYAKHGVDVIDLSVRFPDAKLYRL